MVIQAREFGYGMKYPEIFEGMKKWKTAVERKFPEAEVTLLYNLAGERGRITILTAYPSMADYERIDAALDTDEEISSIMGGVFELFERPMVDQFYRVIS